MLALPQLSVSVEPCGMTKEKLDVLGFQVKKVDDQYMIICPEGWICNSSLNHSIIFDTCGKARMVAVSDGVEWLPRFNLWHSVHHSYENKYAVYLEDNNFSTIVVIATWNYQEYPEYIERIADEYIWLFRENVLGKEDSWYQKIDWQFPLHIEWSYADNAYRIDMGPFRSYHQLKIHKDSVLLEILGAMIADPELYPLLDVAYKLNLGMCFANEELPFSHWHNLAIIAHRQSQNFALYMPTILEDDKLKCILLEKPNNVCAPRFQWLGVADMAVLGKPAPIKI